MAAIAGAIQDATGKVPRKIPFVPKYIKSLLAS
jgi:CO/xanthine dehydrogenase Mo-binding subunit